MKSRSALRAGLRLLPVAMALAAVPASADFTYPGCADVKATDFRIVPLINNAMDASVQEPLKMAFDMDAAGNVDVYFVQRFGKLRKYSGARKAMVTLADFAFVERQFAISKNSAGLIGIALDPGFKVNRWMYLYVGTDSDWRVSRYLVDGDKVDLKSERVVFRFTAGNATTHVAGALRFDPQGHLWITVSDNESKYQSANTNSYLGKILRVKPRPFADEAPAPAPGPGSTYDIPAGNLYPEGTAKVLPEIYVMGARNPYTLALDPVRKGIAWGDVGPDVNQLGNGTEEFNFTAKPGNFGYPFWAGEQFALEPGHGTPAAPVNGRADNTGLADLKPAIIATYAYKKACAVTGPVYWYDGGLKSPVKWPPHFNGAWIVSDFNYSWIDALELDANGAKVLSRLPILGLDAGGQLNKPLELQMGPDGALYVVNYAGYRTTGPRTGLLRIEYAGNCRPVATALQVEWARAGAKLEGSWLTIDQAGTHEVTVWNARGEMEFLRKGSGPGRYDFRPYLGSSLRVVRIRTGAGQVVGKLFRTK